jgi:hypothetical protein
VTGIRPYRSVRVVVLLVVTAYVLWAAVDPVRLDFLHSVSLRLYRTGQLLFAPMGSDLAAWRGSLAQVLLPLAMAVLLGLLHQRFAAAVAFLWLAQNLFNVSVYVSDARARELTLDGPVDPSLDWQRLLEQWGALAHDQTIGSLIHFAGFCIFVFAVIRGFQVALWEQRHF